MNKIKRPNRKLVYIEPKMKNMPTKLFGVAKTPLFIPNLREWNYLWTVRTILD